MTKSLVNSEGKKYQTFGLLSSKYKTDSQLNAVVLFNSRLLLKINDTLFEGDEILLRCAQIILYR